MTESNLGHKLKNSTSKMTNCAKLALLVIVPIFYGCYKKTSNESDQGESPITSGKSIIVESKPNIHLSHVIELFVWQGQYPTRPMVMAAQEYFERYKDHPAITFSDSLLINQIFYFDELTEILLYLEDFPSQDFKYSLSSSPYHEKSEVIKKWIALLAQFYEEANVEQFLLENKAYYQGAINEVKANLPPADFIDQMESYYRTTRLSYTIVPAPEMPTGGAYGQRGIGPYVYTEDGLHIYQVISASLPVQRVETSDGYDHFGFDNKQFVLRNSYHEFGHAFVNPILEKKENQKLIKRYEGSFTPSLKEAMLEQNYNNWSDCVAEHLVRLGEIRLAERSGYPDWAERLRAYHTDSLGFVFLPALEQKILEYEEDADYASFEAYLPMLLSTFEKE